MTTFLVLAACHPVDQPINILFIAIDDLRPELACYGARHVQSPNIDRIASNGILFHRAYCSESWCAPSRTSLMTGMRPNETGVMDLKTHFRDQLPDAITMSQFFKNQGYTTLGFGKIYHNDPKMQDDLSWSKPCWIPPGPSPIQAYATEENQRIARDQPGYKSRATENARVADNAYPDGQVTDQAVNALREMKKEQKHFFLAVGYYKPHLPFTAPSRYWDMYDASEIPMSQYPEPVKFGSGYMFRDWSEPGSYLDIHEKEPYSDSLSRHLKHGYLACISFIDAQVGRLLNELIELDLYDHTIIVLWGDHGWKLGEFGRWSKHSNMEVDTRIPLMMYVPGKDPQKVENIVETIDIYPTLAKLAGFKIPGNLPGENLLQKTREFALSQIPRDSVIGYSIRTPEFRYIEWRNSDQQIVDREYYNYGIDEVEKFNLIHHPGNTPKFEALTNMIDQHFGLPENDR